jgi:hydrogenase maturation protease
LTTDLLVLGLGNPLRGDDAIGPRVVELLKWGGLPTGMEAIDAGSVGFDLLGLLEGPRRVIIVDAADVGLEAGQFSRFTPDEVELRGAAEKPAAHQAGLAEVLALARALGRPLPEIIIFGVQPGSLEWGEGLTAEVDAALPLLVEAVLREF